MVEDKDKGKGEGEVVDKDTVSRVVYIVQFCRRGHCHHRHSTLCRSLCLLKATWHSKGPSVFYRRRLIFVMIHFITNDD